MDQHRATQIIRLASHLDARGQYDLADRLDEMSRHAMAPEEITARAMEMMTLTDDPAMADFVLPDGTMLTTNGQLHGVIAAKILGINTSKSGYQDAIPRLCRTIGAVRTHVYPGRQTHNGKSMAITEIFSPVTPAQMKILHQQAQMADETSIDVSMPNAPRASKDVSMLTPGDRNRWLREQGAIGTQDTPPEEREAFANHRMVRLALKGRDLATMYALQGLPTPTGESQLSATP